jgi:hypothetical protein
MTTFKTLNLPLGMQMSEFLNIPESDTDSPLVPVKRDGSMQRLFVDVQEPVSVPLVRCRRCPNPDSQLELL